MDQVEQYRKEAELCRDMARLSKNPDLRARCEVFAEGYLRFAAEREKFLKTKLQGGKG